MATIAATGYPNLANWAARQKPNGGIADFVNIASEENPVLDDIPWVEGNLPTGHRVTQVNSLPSPSWRKLNAGVAVTKGLTEQYDESCGMLEDESVVDVDLAMLNGDAAAYRASEDRIKMESFAQTFASAVFYESAATNPERIHGLSPRYSDTSGATASSYTLKSSTNSGSNCQSIWLITWAPRKIYGIYPKGSQAGLKVTDEGKDRVFDSETVPLAYRAYVTHLQWKCGIAVEDYRYAVRYSWDPDDEAFADDDRGMYLAMQRMMGTIYKQMPSTRFYMNRTSKIKLDSQLATNDANFLQYISPQGNSGMRIPTFMGVPIRITDALVAEDALA